MRVTLESPVATWYVPSMTNALHLSMIDTFPAVSVRSKAESQHRTLDGCVDGLIQKQGPVRLLTAPEIARSRGQLVQDDEETDAEFAVRSRVHDKLLGLFTK